MDNWNPARYNTYADERAQPFFDLLDLVEPQPDMRVVDLGCGDGRLTGELHKRMDSSHTLGIDSSAAMIAMAPSGVANLTFEHIDIETWGQSSQVWDLVFSNAALQWLSDPQRAIDLAAHAVGPGGQLAAQVPANHASASHRVAAQVATHEPFVSALGGWVRAVPVLTAPEYAVRLHQLGFTRQHVRLQVYLHLLDSRDDVANWVRGTLLLAYLDRLPVDLHDRFEAAYREALNEVLPDERPFLFPFERILIWGRR